MYVVMYFEEGMGYYFTKSTKIFSDYDKAVKWADAINSVLAVEDDCEVRDLFGYYIIKEVEWIK